MTKEKREKSLRVLGVVFGLCALCMVLVIVLQYMGILGRRAEITVSAVDVSVLQGEDMPDDLQSRIQAKDAEDLILDKKEKYTVEDLVEDLKLGKGYTITTDARVNREGSYDILIKLHSDIQKKLDGPWKRKVRVKVQNGRFKVKNPVGEWDGNKFRRYDGTYITDGFVVSEEKTYYFDTDGQMVTGKQEIKGDTYFFDKDGVMETGWKYWEDGTYYLADNGAAVTGWQTVDEKTFYFESNGRMAVGEVPVGLAVCTFDEDGKFVSKTQNNVDPGKPMVALTFDDGPGERTGELLDQLERYNAHATFFMLGRKVSGRAEVVEKMKEIGCELGNHSYDHPKLSKSDAAGVQDQVNRTNKAVQDATGQPATVMRPPYGAISDTLRANVGMPMILWNIDTLDWKTRNAQTTIDTVMEKVKDGDIILMHDIHTESVDAALALIPKLQAAGYQLVTVSELAQAKGIALQNGEKYTDF